MSTTKTRSNRPVGIQKVTDPAGSAEDALTRIVSDLLKTREVRQLLTTVVPELFKVWAEKSWWKTRISKLAGSMVKNQLTQPDDIFENDEISALFENEEFIKDVAEQLPSMINQATDAFVKGIGSIESLSAEEKKQAFEAVLSKAGQGRIGTILTRCAKTLTDIHDKDPEFFAKALEPAVIKWVESLDLGEIKEMFDKSGKDGRAIVEMVMTVLFEYPTKFVVLLTYLPGLANFVADSLEIILKKVNTFPPDMLTDVVLVIAKQFDDDAIANLLNQLTEVFRKIHTGSELIGEPGSPKLPKDLADIVAGIVDKLDPVVLWKAKIALAQIKAAVSQAAADAVNDSPEYRRLNMASSPELFNIRTKSLNHNLTSWDAVDDEQALEDWSAHLSAYDVQEAAEAVNNMMRLINRLAEEKPMIFGEVIGQFSSAVDDYELSESVKNVFTSAAEEIRPAARAVVPGLVTWICDVLQPEDDEYEEDAARAREALQSLFAVEEVN